MKSSMKMSINKALLGCCCAALLCLAACSRQQSDWEKTRAANTTDSYEQFLKKYPSGEFTAQAKARVQELYEERDWQKARDADTQDAYQAFIKQYPDGKWSEEARIRVENFSLAQVPSTMAPSSAAPSGADTVNTPVNSTAPGGPAAGAAPAAKPQPAPSAATAPPAKATKPPANTAMPRTKTSPKAATGSYGIQLGAFQSGAPAAHKRWEHLKAQYPKLLAGLTPTISPKKSATGTVYRLQALGLTEKRAHLICKTLKAKSQACVPLNPAPH